MSLSWTAAGQQLPETTFSLTPTLPNYFGDPLANYRLTTGDLNGDGVPDLVCSNAVAFVRVYYLQKDANGVPYVSSFQDLMPYVANDPNQCATSPRFRTVSPYFLDNAVIYDINLDGVNDLIYLKHFSTGGNGEVRLQVYKWNGVRLQADTHASSSTLNLLPLLQTGAGHGFFSSSCSSHDKAPGECFYMKVVNLRGRAFPQDILVWTANPPYNPNVRVYAYDTNGGTPTLTLLIEHFTKNNFDPVQGWKAEGLAGHTWGSLDIDNDGVEELIGKHVMAYDPSAPGNKRLLWGINLKSDFDSQSVSGPDDPHPDYVSGTDLLRSHRDEAGNLLPAPGMEILVAPHTHPGVVANSCDPSGPWIYRAITGHQQPIAGPVAWPRKLINIVSGLNAGQDGSGENYWFPSTSIGWDQPTSSSHWNDLGNAFAGSGISNKRPDPQVAFPCDIIYDPVNGVDLQPGPEIIVLDKLGGLTGGCSPGGENHYVFSSGDALTALGWGANNLGNVNGPTILGTFPLDIQGNRDQIEMHSIVQFCNGASTPAPHVILSWHRINPDGSPDAQGRTFAPSVIYSRGPVTGVDSIGGMDGTTGHDLMGDRREELLFWRNYNPQGGSFTNSQMVVVRDGTGNYTEPPPQKFLDYRLYVHDPQHVDFKSFDGLRFRTRHLMSGKTNSVYGVPQDKKLVGTLPTEKQTGCAILAEGGTGPYSFSINQGVLPVGLATQALSLSGSFPAGVLQIHGTPIEVTTKRLEITVTDSSVPPQSRVQSFWITVKGGGGGFSLVDSVPRITAGGFDNAYLIHGQTQTLPVMAEVSDLGDDVVSVKLYDKFGVEQSSLTHVSGNTWTGTFQASLPVEGRDTWYTMRAQDSAGNLSVPWPYLVVNGGPGEENAPFLDEPYVQQPQSLTPFVKKVGMPAHTIPAAEISDGQGTQSLTIDVDRRGLTVTKVEARIVHHLPGVDAHRYEKILTPSNGTLDQYALTFDSPPPGELGWGYYTVNVQVTVQAAGGATYVSDWWPQLTAH